MNLKSLILACALGVYAADSLAATVTAVRSWRAPDNTRLVLDLSEKIRYRQVNVSAKQVVIELSDTDIAVAAPSLPTNVGLVKSVQFERDGNKQLLIINLSNEVKPHIFDLPANDQYSPRLVIDLFDKVTLQPLTPPEDESASAGDNQGRPVIVVVDAGHGGEDVGAIGSSGFYEKHVTLAIARKLVAMLRKTDGFKAYLTRDDDYFIPLQDRRKIARNRYKADIFISIHADAALSPLAKGASVFALSRKGANSATSRFAQALADKENKSDLMGGVDADAGRDSQLTNILADMVVEGSVTQSLHMGGLILGEMGELGRLHSRHVEQAGFAVLKEPGMISVLVETGFITNPDEERRLTDPDGQQRIAQAVLGGVKSFLHKYPLSKTYFAWGKEQRSVKQRSKVLKEIVAAPEVKPLVLTADKFVDKPVLVNTPPVVEPAKAVVAVKVEPQKPVEPVKSAVVSPDPMTALLNKPPLAEKPEPTVVIESRPLSAQPLPPVKIHKVAEAKVEVINPEKTAPIVNKPMVKATLPASLSEFMAETPKTGTAKPAEKSSAPTDKAKPKLKTDTKADSKTETQSTGKVSKHTVMAGDTLSSIAAQHHVSVDELVAWNKLKNDSALLGTTLRLTAPKGQPADTKTETKTEAKSTAKTEAADTKAKAKAKTHKVKEGDSLSSIAAKYGVPAQAIRDLNKLKEDNVLLDSTLKIPAP